MSAPRRVLLALAEAPLARSLAEVLRARSHPVTVVHTAGEACLHADHDVLVADVALPGGGGLELIEELARNGLRPRAVVLSRRPDLAACRRALRLGAADFLALPCSTDELLKAIDGEDGAARGGRRRAEPGRFRRSFAADPPAVERAAREVSAYALRCSLSPSARARVATATAELVENVVRHAYPGRTGTVSIEVVVDPRRLTLRVADTGVGCDSQASVIATLRASTDGGLARVSALSEDMRVETDGRGTRVVVVFDVFRVLFDEGDALDLTELDWLAPETTRGLLDLLGADANGPALHLSPALAVTVGRLLTGPDKRRVLQTALWS